MGVRSAVTASAIDRMAPGVAAIGVRQLVHRAIDGLAGFPGARAVAQKALREKGGVEAAIDAVIDSHLRLAGAQGFATGFGGVVTAAVTLPANVAVLGVLHIRMVAAIAHLRGYDLSRPAVRLACLEAIIGEEDVERLVGEGKLPGRPRDVAAMDRVEDKLVDAVAGHVGGNLVGRVTGKRLALTVTRRVPLLGGGVGAVVDGLATRQVGRYADREFRPRLTVERV
jgi:hypothetical protein